MGHSRRVLFTVAGLATLSWSCDLPEAGTSRLGLGEGATVTGEPIRMTVQSGDPDRQLFVSTGVAVEHAHAVCEGGMQRDWVDTMELREVTTPSGGTVLRVEGDVHTLVYASTRDWAFTNDFGEFYDAFCEAVLTTAPIASGISHAAFSDSYGRQGDHWGLKAEGQLQDGQGNALQFVHAGACVISDWATDTLRCTVQVNLH